LVKLIAEKDAVMFSFSSQEEEKSKTSLARWRLILEVLLGEGLKIVEGFGRHSD